MNPPFPSLPPLAYADKDGAVQRAFWVAQVVRLSRPLLELAAEGDLRGKLSGRLDMPPGHHVALEACSRVILGLAPWVGAHEATGDSQEESLRQEMRQLIKVATVAGTRPDHAGGWNWNDGDQCLVDAAKIALATLLAPDFFREINSLSQGRLVESLMSTRHIPPHFNNWLLFSASVEAAIDALGGQPDLMRVDFALKQFEQWYVGDGHYSDGKEFHADYYNSLVIHPQLVAVSTWLAGRSARVCNADDAQRFRNRLGRYAAVLERSISPEGTFPGIGRSLGSRFGCLFGLSFASLIGALPGELAPSQVRCALTAVLERFVSADPLVGEDGLLQVGFIAEDSGLVEFYAQQSAAYIMLVPACVLGLPADSEFWSAPPQPWSMLRLWSGQPVPRDHALGHHLTFRHHTKAEM